MKLSVRLPLLFGIVVLVTCICLTLVTLYFSSMLLEQSIMEGISAENEANSELLSVKITAQLNILAEIANRSRIRTMDWEQVQPSLVPDVTRIGALDMAMTTPDGVSRYVLDNSTVEISDRDYFRRAMSGETNAEVVFSRISNSIVVMFAAPIYQDDQPASPVVGVLLARMDGGRTLSDLVVNIKSSMESGFHYLVNADGTMIAHPNNEWVRTEFNPIKQAETDPSFRSFADMMTLALRERDGDSRYYHAGVYRIGHFSDVPGYPWLLFGTVERREIDSRIARLRLIALGIGAIFIVVGILVAFIIGSAIAKSVSSVADTLKDISEGEGDLTRIININSKDEIGSLSHYFNLTLEKIKNLVMNIRTEASSLSNIGIDLASNMNETAAAVNQITANIQSIKGRIINQSASVTETHATMDQVVANINKLNEVVERQTSSVAQSSSAIEEMFANIQSVIQTLGKNVENVGDLTSASEVGKGSLYEVADDIKQIAQDSEGLMEINSVMGNIASQTNLLSMNAAIEAAHAGDAGKGFAVVADEIRKLAASSSTQSKTISMVLKKIKESIDKITKSTENVLNRFDTIEASVKIVADQEENIRNAMEEQGQGSKQILEAVGHLNEITRQVKDGSLEMLDGSKEVISESENLEKATQEISGSMNEMVQGVEEINLAVHQINELSSRNRENINHLIQEVSRFKVE